MAGPPVRPNVERLAGRPWVALGAWGPGPGGRAGPGPGGRKRKAEKIGLFLFKEAVL